MKLKAVSLDAPVAKNVIDALWGTQWTTRWAAENTVCAYGCSRESYQDQKDHFGDCEFVALWKSLSSVRADLGDTRILEYIPVKAKKAKAAGGK